MCTFKSLFKLIELFFRIDFDLTLRGVRFWGGDFGKDVLPHILLFKSKTPQDFDKLVDTHNVSVRMGSSHREKIFRNGVCCDFSDFGVSPLGLQMVPEKTVISSDGGFLSVKVGVFLDELIVDLGERNPFILYYHLGGAFSILSQQFSPGLPGLSYGGKSTSLYVLPLIGNGVFDIDTEGILFPTFSNALSHNNTSFLNFGDMITPGMGFAKGKVHETLTRKNYGEPPPKLWGTPTP